MSTKVSYIFGTDFHFYFDYEDMEYHLMLKGKEIEMPMEFKESLIALCAIRNSVDTIKRNAKKLERIEGLPE